MMKTRIPSPVLARIQLMFQSGATLDEVTEALDLDTTWQPDPHTAPQTVVKDMTPVVAAPPVASPANDIKFPRLEELSGKLEEHVSSLLERDDIRDTPTISGSLDAIYQFTAAIRKEISAAPLKQSDKPVAAVKSKPKTVASKPQKTATPPALKVQKPKTAAKKAPAKTPVKPTVQTKSAPAPAPEKLKPTGELPAAAKRRAAAHPFAASLVDDAPSAPAPVANPTVPKAAPILSADNPSSEYRDRIAAAMNQISTIADQHERDEDYIAVRHS